MDGSNACTWPEVKQRAHYLAWLGTAVGTAGLVGLTVDLAVVALTGGAVGLELVPLLYACMIFPPLVYGWRRHGEAYHGFLELEHALDQAWSPAGPGSRYGEIADFIARIEQARGMDRQVVRLEAKQWLLANAGKLSREEREFVAEHLGYLRRPERPERPAAAFEI